MAPFNPVLILWDVLCVVVSYLDGWLNRPRTSARVLVLAPAEKEGGHPHDNLRRLRVPVVAMWPLGRPVLGHELGYGRRAQGSQSVQPFLLGCWEGKLRRPGGRAILLGPWHPAPRPYADAHPPVQQNRHSR